MATILEDDFNGGSFDSNWTEVETNGTATVNTDSKKEGSYGYDCDVLSGGSDNGIVYIYEDFSSESELWVRFWFNFYDATNFFASSMNPSDIMDAYNTAASYYGGGISAYKDGSNYYLQPNYHGFWPPRNLIGTAKQISLNTWYQIRFKLKNAGSSDIIAWWVDTTQISSNTGNYLGGNVNRCYFGHRSLMISGGWNCTFYYDQCGIFDSDPGDFSEDEVPVIHNQVQNVIMF